MDDLSDFFSAISVGKKKRKEEIDAVVGDAVNDFFSAISEGKKKVKEERSQIAGDSFETLFWEELTKPTPKPKKKKKIIVEEIQEPPVLEELEVIEKVVQEIIEEPKEELEEKSLGLLSEPSDVKQQNDPLTPLNQNFATIEDLNNHYKLFLSRIQQQLSTLGGGGETRLEFLDDVDRNSAKRDNYFLKYDANINKWVGDDGGGVGITSIVFITGITTYYQATKDVDYIGVSADVPVVIDLPTNAAPGKEIIVKDEGNKISTYNITVRAGIGASVENSDSVIMKVNHESFTYFYNGYNWYIV